MSADPDVGAVAPDVTEPVATGAVVEDGEVEEKSTPAYEPPADIGKFPDDEPASGGREAVQPAAEPTRRPEPEYRQPAGPQPDPWGKAIDYSGEDVYAKGSKVVEDHIRERVGALANTVSAVVRDQADKIASLEKRLSELGSKPAAMQALTMTDEEGSGAPTIQRSLARSESFTFAFFASRCSRGRRASIGSSPSSAI